MPTNSERNSTNPYSTLKLASQPEALEKLRKTGKGSLISVHLMPQNLCNQRCSFCSYRLPDNKNSSHFTEKAHLSFEAMTDLVSDLARMEVQGVEVTGGGEPLAYPHIVPLMEMLSAFGFAVGLVSNGTLYSKLAPEYLEGLVGSRLKWVRISIDSATPETYSRMRKAPGVQFDRAWQAVRQISRARKYFSSEFRLGVGFVLSNENTSEVYQFVKMARDNGADNVRLSFTFSDQHMDYFQDKEAVAEAVDESLRARLDFETEDFKVHNLMPKRAWETQHPIQDYKRCPTKDLLCVVEGTGKVYTCCTFTGSLSGLYGNFTEHPGGFKGLWEEKDEWRRKWDTRKMCPVACLYRDRNLAMNDLIDSNTEPNFGRLALHREFI